MWAFAAVFWQDRPLLAVMAERLLLQPDNLRPEQLAATVWSLARSSLRHLSLESAVEACLAQMSEFGPQELSNTAWAVAIIQIQNAQLRETISKRAAL